MSEHEICSWCFEKITDQEKRVEGDNYGDVFCSQDCYDEDENDKLDNWDDGDDDDFYWDESHDLDFLDEDEDVIEEERGGEA